MPATFPSHAAAVLPLKWWKPRWFDGIALTAGSAAPDVAYALDGTWLEWPARSLPPAWALAHSWVGVALWGLPVTLACCWIIRAAFRFRAPGLVVTACSAVIGAASHVLWDRLAVDPVADVASSVLGAIVTLALLFVHFGRPKPERTLAAEAAIPAAGRRKEQLRRAGVAELSAIWRHRAELNWVASATVLVAGGAVVPVLPGAGLAHTTGVRLLLVAGLAVVAGRVMRRKER